MALPTQSVAVKKLEDELGVMIFERGQGEVRVTPVGERIVDYVVADASGHDLGVSLWTASFKTLLTEYVSAVDAPLDTCRAINESLKATGL